MLLIQEKERKERLLSRINTLEKKHKSLCEELGIVYIEVESDATLQKRENLINEEVLFSNNYTNKMGLVDYAERKNCINVLMEYQRYSINHP